MTDTTRADGNVATYTPASPELFAEESKRMAQVSGLVGKVWGDVSHAPANIAGIALIFLLTFGGVIMFFPSSMKPAEYWATAFPVVTLILGYLFGKKS